MTSDEIRDREFQKFIDSGTFPSLATLERPMTQAFENNATGQPIYVGKAEPGTLQSATGWQIMKLTYDGTAVVKMEWADGTSKFDKTWTLRATGYTYS